MFEAFGWGFLAQSSLLVAGLVVCWLTVPTKLVGILGGFGAGAMIAAVAFDLPPESEIDIGFLATDLTSAVQGDRAAALAAGGLLAMPTNSLIPFSFERGGQLAGAATTLGFCLSVMTT